MNRNSLFLKLFLANLLIVGLVLTVAGVLSYQFLNAEYLREVSAYQDQLAGVAQQYVERAWPQGPAEMDRLCKQFPTPQAAEGPGEPERLPVRLTIVAADGRVLGDSRGNPAEMENHSGRPEVREALAGRTGTSAHRSETFDAPYRYVALPIYQAGEAAPVGAVRVAMPQVAIAETQAVLRHALIWTVVAVLAVFAPLALLVNWIWYRPLKRLARAARGLASGDLEGRVRIRGSTELAQLAQALNEMRERLAQHIKIITAQRQGLEQVIATLGEGLIAIGVGDRVVMANQAALDLLAPGESAPTGRHLQTLVRAPAIIDIYHEALRDGRAIRRQIEFDVRGASRSLDVQVAPVGGGAGEGLVGLIVVRDVTDLVRAAAMKSEFVANASHELRTPLATLRAAVDSLTGADLADPESTAKLIAILDRHVRRLEGLPLDLLDLHQVETAKHELALQPIPVASLLESARTQFAARAAEKGILLELAAAHPEDVFASDRPLIELMLRNLVDNAIKFTPGGGRVACRLDRDGARVRLVVSDTGVGISREDQGRVFERFFQADDARSGDPGSRGTGLGLAIVKHACERLGATVSLESELGKGTTVTVVVPDRSGAV